MYAPPAFQASSPPVNLTHIDCLLCKAKRKLAEITLKHLNAKLQSPYRKRRPQKQRPKTEDPLQDEDHLENEDSLENEDLLENEDPLEKHHV